MNRKFINFYFVAVLSIFIFSISFFVSKTYLSYKNGSLVTEHQFNELQNINANSENILKKMDEFSKDSNVVAFKVLKNKKGYYIKNDSFDFETSSSMLRTLSTSFNVDDDIYELTAVIYKLNPIHIYKNARTAFLIVLFFTVLTAILLIIISEKLNKQTDETFTAEESETDSISETEPVLPEITEENSGNNDNETSEINAPQSEGTSTIEIPEETELETEIKNQDENTSENTSENTENNTDTQCIDEEDVFSNKLENLIESAKDVSLFLIKIDPSDVKQKIVSLLKENFFSADEVFIISENLLCALKEGMEIDDAEDYASDIHGFLLSSFTEQLKVFIGISSKATRTLTKNRLRTEAEEALKHAENDLESNIVGFHVDIEKYNEFIANEKK